MENWQIWVGVFWLLFVGYCFGRAHECWYRFSKSLDKLQKLSDKIVNKE